MRQAARDHAGRLTREVRRVASPDGLKALAILGRKARDASLGSLHALRALDRLPGRPGALARHDLRPAPPKVYGRVGDLEVRLAGGRADIESAQRLRYRVFYEEMSATPSFVAQMRRRDEDAYDAFCDHLLVVDRAEPQASAAWKSSRRPNVVGTYRVLRDDVARHRIGFYTQSEYDIAPLMLARPQARFMELGRSCVLKPYRTRRTVEMLWHGLWTYVREHKVDVMIGCASFPGTDPQAHAMALSYLHHHALAPPEWRAHAHAGNRVGMNLVAADKLDARAALKAMPPLIKGYLRLGAWFGEGAVVDRQFGTTDVLVVMPVARIDARYFEHFGAPDEAKSRIA